MGRDLLLNVAPVEVEDGEVVVRQLPFESPEQLRSLRIAHAKTHVFRRVGSQIECVLVDVDASPIGDRAQSVWLRDRLPLAAALIRNALVDYLAGLGRQIEGFRPIAFISRSKSENLLAGATPAGVECPDWLFVRPLFEMDVRVMRLDKREPFVGLALNVRTLRRINIACNELLRGGLALEGSYVGSLCASEDSRIAPYLQVVGRVERVIGDMLHLADARDGRATITASDAVLEARPDTFTRVLEHVFRQNAQRISTSLDGRLQTLRSGPGRLDRLSKVITFLSTVSLQLAPDVRASVRPFLQERLDRSFPTILTAPKPVYVFSATGASTDTWNDRGLRKFGPYSADVFTPTRPRICVICQASRKGQVEQFLHKFLFGMRPKGRDDRSPFAEGFIRKYQLEGATPEFFLAHGSSAEAYRAASRAALEQQGTTGGKWDLALVQVEEAFHELFGELNPYLVCKGTFLAQQINVQEFEIETITNPNETQLAYSLNNMALATYAKLGGVPWLLQSDRTIAHELVIGLGSASIGEGRFGSRDRVVGITTVFSGDGSYHLSNVSKAVSLAEYKDAVLVSLRTCVQRVQRSMNWQPRDHVRLVVHSFKPLKDLEVEAVSLLMRELGDYQVDLAFIHVVENHPFLLFDLEQSGTPAFGSKGKKGELAPTRGWFFRISGDEVLLSLTGARELKRPEDGMPWPVLLRLHRDSTFKDTTYLAKQMFAFSSHSWRSFFPSSMPVTIVYSELVARMLGQLSKMPWWTADAMLGRIGSTRWFL